MDNKLTKAKEILHHYNQEHLLYFYDELSEEQKELLLNQILGIDFNKILTLYKNSFKSTKLDLNTVSPLPHIEKDKISKEDLEHYIAIGENIIKSGFLAIVTMAGGQGTRLGYKGPKGTYELDFEQEHCRKSLFEIMCENIKNANNQYDITLPWYIMTSEDNDFATKEYFKSHNFFDYPKEKIKFFKQEKLPIVNIDGKLILKETYLIKDGSNGNGNVFKAMKNNKIIDDLEASNLSNKNIVIQSLKGALPTPFKLN